MPADEDWVGQPHDGLFRGALARLEDARSALEAAMPTALAGALDFERLAFLPARIVDALFAQGESDALFEVPFRENEARIVLHVPVEHQSKPDLDIPVRLLRTKLRLWEKQRDEGLPLSPVIPLVVSHGRPWSSPRNMLERLALPEAIEALVAPYTPQYTYLLDDLARYDPEALAQRPMLTPRVRVAYFFLQRARESPALEHELHFVRDDFSHLAEGAGAIATLGMFVRYTLRVGKGDEEALREKLREAIGPKLEEIVMGTYAENIFERGRAEGEARGRVEGEARGRVEGEARGRASARVEILTRLLELKFGTLTQATHERLASASVELLDTFTSRVLSATTLEDILRDA